jgi:hypothetical protein
VELYPLVTVSCPDGENRVLGSISDKWPLHLEVIGQRGRAKR